jgi:hypothetical protein
MMAAGHSGPPRLLKNKSLRRQRAERPFDPMTAGGWIDGLRLVTSSLLAPQAIDITSPGSSVRSPRILGFASAPGEILGFQPKAVDPAASTNGFPKASRPLAARGFLRIDGEL